MRRLVTFFLVIPLLGAIASPTVAQTTTEELLAGMVTEEVEPGVFRVDRDGIRSLTFQRQPGDPTWFTLAGLPIPTIVAGDDGGTWILHRDGYFRVGIDHARSDGRPDDLHPDRYWPFDRRPYDFEVASDGTVWAAIETDADPVGGPTEGGPYLWSFDGGEWAMEMPMDFVGNPVEITPDGTVWAVWPDESGQLVFGRLGATGRQQMGGWPFNGDLLLSDDGDIWTVGWTSNIFETYPRRFVDGAWQSYGQVGNPGEHAAVGPDGTLWAVAREGLTRFDGSDWQTFRRPDWLPKDQPWWLVENEWMPMEDQAYASAESEQTVLPELGRPHVAPDGSVWVTPRLGRWGDQLVCDAGIGGAARFDGLRWDRYLKDRCVEAMDIAADGSVWLLASEAGATYPVLRTYVITPEAVAAE